MRSFSTSRLRERWHDTVGELDGIQGWGAWSGLVISVAWGNGNEADIEVMNEFGGQGISIARDGLAGFRGG